MTKTEYQVSGMHCGGCEGSVRDEVIEIEGVTQVDVSAATGRLVVHSDSDLSDEIVLAAVGDAGYKAVRES